MVDAEGYRPNVGIILLNDEGNVFFARRIGQNAWQFPQGGIQDGESEEEALYRELKEEIGLEPENVEILGCTKEWLHYKLPKPLIRYDEPDFIGQKQKWFLLHLTADDDAIDVLHHDDPEFDGWAWVSYWYPMRHVINFKKHVYRRALKFFSRHEALKAIQTSGINQPI